MMALSWSSAQVSCMSALGLEAWSLRDAFSHQPLVLQTQYMTCVKQKNSRMLLAVDFYEGDQVWVQQQNNMREAILKAIGFRCEGLIDMRQAQTLSQGNDVWAVLAFGQHAYAKLFGHTSSDPGLVRQCYERSETSLQVCLYSMLSMLRNPCLKKEAWPLLKRLSVDLG